MTSPTPDLFEMTVNANGFHFLKDAARWARLMAITGIVFCGFFVAFDFWSLSYTMAVSVVPGWHTTIYPPSFLIGMAIQFVFPVFYFFPCLLLLRFAARTQKALRSRDGELLARSFKTMRAVYRLIGIFLIVGIGIFLLAMAVAIMDVPRVSGTLG